MRRGETVDRPQQVWPRISVIIPTCDRSEDLRRCLRSLTSVAYTNWEVLVIDQSPNDGAREAVADFEDALPSLAYRRLTVKGLSRARNLGSRLASGDLIAFVDDDCTVEPDWLQTIAAAFERHPGVALVCGTVLSALDLRTAYVPEYHVSEEREVIGNLTTRHVGIGASMYLSREAADQVGQWDDHLGSGARFKSAEDWDYSFRLLRRGYLALVTPAIVVHHFGGRSYADNAARALWRNIAYSQGAMHMKHLRCGDLVALIWILAAVRSHVSTVRPLNLLRRGQSSHLARVVFYLRGLVSSFALPVDRRHRVYVDSRHPVEEWQAVAV